MGKRPWQQEHETASHIAPAGRRERDIMLVSTASFLFCLGPYPMGWCHPQSRMALSCSVKNLSGHIFIDTLRDVFLW